jgi:endonuclease/exonuclease/phosphatase family metal-dependent hydrolase
MTPIFYRQERLEMLEHSTFWLSPDESCIRGWDAACRRTVTWARFRDRENESVFWVFNTHFDHLGMRARRESAWLLVRKVAALSGSEPTVVTGDFNSRESSKAYAILTGEHRSDPGSLLGFKDAYYLAEYPPLGPKATWQGLLCGAIGRTRLDYIFVKNDVRVVQHAVFPTHCRGNVASDHSPVVAEIHLGQISEAPKRILVEKAREMVAT